MNRDPDCIFCKIVAGEIPCFKIYEDDATLAFMDINPTHPGHALAIARPHFANVYEISDEVIAATVQTAGRVARAVKATLAPRRRPSRSTTSTCT
jgi:histidine triad (HIT) family protein